MINRLCPEIAIVCACLLALANGSVSAAPFSCTRDAFVIQAANAQLSTIDQSVIPFTLIPIGGAASFTINNLGFRRTDGLLYGYRTDLGNRQIVSIDNLGAGNATLLGLGGLPLPLGFAYNSGDIAPDGSEMYFTVNGLTTIHTIALPGLGLIRTRSITGGIHPVLDWAAHPTNGLLYGGVTDGKLAELDPVTGIRIDKAIIGGPLPIGTSFGSAWFNANGRLFLYRNSGAIYEIANVATVPALLNSTLGVATTGINDGAACIQDVLGVAKSMASSNPAMIPATITIDYLFENFDIFPVGNLSAIDDLTAVFGAHGTDWTFTSISSSANIVHNASFTGYSNTELVEQTVGNPEQDLLAGTTATVTVVLELLTSNGDTDMNDEFCNQIVVTGTQGGVIFSDQSTDGFDPDPDADGIPDEHDPSCLMQMLPVELMKFTVE